MSFFIGHKLTGPALLFDDILIYSMNQFPFSAEQAGHLKEKRSALRSKEEEPS